MTFEFREHMWKNWSYMSGNVVSDINVLETLKSVNIGVLDASAESDTGDVALVSVNFGIGLSVLLTLVEIAMWIFYAIENFHELEVEIV
jgi:hypothetical protein